MTQPLNVLALDTCFASCSVAVATGVGTPQSRVTSRFEEMSKGQAERILPMVAETVGAAGIAPGQLGLIAVTVGPGSFTGTRIGIAAAKGLALACGIEAAGFTSLHVIARQVALVSSGDDALCIAIDMGRRDVYAQAFEPGGVTPITDPTLVTVDMIEAFASSHDARLIGNGARFVSDPQDFSSHFIPRAETLVALVTQCKRKYQAATPLYLRAPDATPAKPVDMAARVRR